LLRHELLQVRPLERVPDLRSAAEKRKKTLVRSKFI
jgi:hypothetical protein